jgi:hypothetical protein
MTNISPFRLLLKAMVEAELHPFTWEAYENTLEALLVMAARVAAAGSGDSSASADEALSSCHQLLDNAFTEVKNKIAQGGLGI